MFNKGKKLLHAGALLPAIMVSLVAGGSARADVCSTMLAPVFTTAKITGSDEGRAFVTVTKHYAGGNTSGNPNPVRYAYGPLAYAVQSWSLIGGWSDTLYGTISPYRQNTTQSATQDMFAPSNPALSLAFRINSYGAVSVQELLGGKPIGGMPPSVYQGACSGGLVTVIDHSTGWTFSFSTVVLPAPPK